MRFSVGLPTGMEGLMYPIPFAGIDDILIIARRAEELGYEGVWGNDHMTTQAYVRQEFDTPPNYWELLITLTAIAMQTSRLRIGTGVLIPAMRRDIVVLAKQIATLDHISKGRLTLGVGVGAYREEFEALQPNCKIHRGDALEESLKAIRTLFSRRNADWEGKYYQYRDVEMYPKPIQQPFPIYIGGNSPNALRRAAHFGQGWIGAGMPPEQFKTAINKIYQYLTDAGRAGESFDIAPQFSACLESSYEIAINKFRQSQMYKHLISLSKTTLKDQVDQGFRFEEIDLVGDKDEIIKRIATLQQIGVTHLAGILFTANSVSDYLDQMQRFAEEIIPFFQ